MQVDRSVTELELAAGLQTLYGDTMAEPVPEGLTSLLAKLGNVEAGDAMGGRASPAVLTPGGR